LFKQEFSQAPPEQLYNNSVITLLLYNTIGLFLFSHYGYVVNMKRRKQRESAEALADRRLFLLDDAQWTAFMTALDAPERPMPRLERLLQEPTVLTARDKPPL